MNLKNNFTIAILIVISKIGFSQNVDKDLENKYWNYKDRLNKYFTQIGNEKGQSLTAAQILPENQLK